MERRQLADCDDTGDAEGDVKIACPVDVSACANPFGSAFELAAGRALAGLAPIDQPALVRAAAIHAD